MAIGVAIVGAGFGRRVHLPGFGQLASLGVEIRHFVTRQWPIVVEDGDVDLVSIATPPATHREIALAALTAGKAVLCEKPLAATLADAEELAGGAREAGVPTLVDFEFRGLPAFRHAKELLVEGSLGRVERAEVEWRLGGRPPGTQVPSWKDSAELGGGTLLSLGVHSFDYVEWLLGPVARLESRLEVEPGRSDSGFTARLELASGAAVDVEVTTQAAHPTGHAVRIHCEGGSLALLNRDVSDYMRGFRLDLDGSTVVPPTGGGEDGRIAPFVELARELVEAVSSGGRCEPSFEEGLRAQRIAEAVRRSDGAPSRPETQV